MKEGADSTPNFSAILLASDAPRLEACSNKGLFFKQSIRFSSTRILVEEALHDLQLHQTCD